MIYDVIDEFAIWEDDEVDPQYFYDVIADELLNRLSKSTGLGSFRFMDGPAAGVCGVCGGEASPDTTLCLSCCW